MPDLVTRMTMGQAVPEWLLTTEPEYPNAHRGHFRFCVDVDVIDTPAYYVVLPNLAFHPPGAPTIDNVGMVGCRILAASKPVVMAVGGAIIYGAETTPHFKALEEQVRLAQAAAQEEAAQYRNAQVVERTDAYVHPGPVAFVPDPHPTFWSRLLYVFRGR